MLNTFKLISICSVLWFHLVSCGNQNIDEPYEPPTKDTTSTLQPNVNTYLTLANQTQKLAKQESYVTTYNSNLKTIEIDTNSQLQTMDGFGFALTGGSALHINSMSISARKGLLDELFAATPKGIGLSFIRVSLGASDLDASPFSYADTPNDEPDLELNSFSIAKDQENLIPVLKEILAINPDVKIMASPWSPPVWMKTNQSSKGGQLATAYYEVYAQYFVRYIQAMQSEGINIEFITIQNEPLHPGNNPSLSMSASEQAKFLGENRGPAFEAEGIDTKILLYDHNPDRIDYPLEVLKDTKANKYAYGSAFHLYAGQVSALSQVYSQFPDKHIYFTEQWYGAPGNFSNDLRWHTREVIVGATRNWSRSIIEWNLTSNPQLEPHTDGGCDKCLGAITLDGDKIIRNAGYYIIGHISSFVAANSKRINSNFFNELPNVAFINPKGQKTLIVLNDSDNSQEFSVSEGEIQFSATLDAGAVATFYW